MFSNHNIWHFLFLIQLKLKENNKYSPRYRGSKFQNFKSPIRGDFGSFSGGIFTVRYTVLWSNPLIIKNGILGAKGNIGMMRSRI